MTKGKSKRVEPIRDLGKIRELRGMLLDHPRDRCLLDWGLETGLRASEILSIRAGDVIEKRAGEEVSVGQKKTGGRRRRLITMNDRLYESTQRWLAAAEPPLGPEDFLFRSQKAPVLTVVSVSAMVKRWCERVGLVGNYASHSLRKTWGYWQRQSGTPLPLLMEVFGHATQRQTLDYLCIQPEEVEDVYKRDIYASRAPDPGLSPEQETILAAARAILEERK